MGHTGLSPRGRGNLQSLPSLPEVRRSIPAWAGKPPINDRQIESTWVYPRVGGETASPALRASGVCGLSPRGRGNHPGDRAAAGRGGSIPAWAGKPRSGELRETITQVYPRVGGETTRRVPADQVLHGLSPRGRGDPRDAGPRVPDRGSIPAWAGKPRGCGNRHQHVEVYPRVGGETCSAVRLSPPAAGLSPRGRGNLWCRGR